MLDQGFQFSERLGAFERTADGDIISYPLGYMFSGVRMTSDRFFGRCRRWRGIYVAGAVIAVWSVLVFTFVLVPPQDEHDKLIRLMLIHHCVWLFLLRQVTPLVFAPSKSRVFPTPWRRLRRGEIMLPLYGSGRIAVWIVLGAFVWLAPVSGSDVHRVVIKTFNAELAAFAFATAAYRIYCNWRITRASAAWVAKSPQLYVWPRRSER